MLFAALEMPEFPVAKKEPKGPKTERFLTKEERFAAKAKSIVVDPVAVLPTGISVARSSAASMHTDIHTMLTCEMVLFSF